MERGDPGELEVNVGLRMREEEHKKLIIGDRERGEEWVHVVGIADVDVDVMRKELGGDGVRGGVPFDEGVEGGAVGVEFGGG